MKKFLSLMVALAVFAVGARAATLNDRYLNLLLGSQQAEYNDYNDSAAFSIKNAAGTASTMTISQTSIVVQTGGNYYVSLATASYLTVGSVYDALVATHSGVYTLTDMDMRRGESSELLGDVSGQSIATAYSVIYDTGGAPGVAGTMFKSQIALTPASGKRIRLFKVTGNADITSASATDVITVFKEASGTYAETEVIKSPILTDSTDKSITFTSNEPHGGLDFAEDERVIIRTQGDETQDAGAGTTVFYMEW